MAEDDPDVQLHHQRVTDVWERTAACLPARYGTRFASEAQLCEQLEAQQSTLAAALERVRGTAELAVTALWVQEPEMPADTTPGRAHLLEVLERTRTAKRIADAVARAAAPLAMRQARSARPEIAASVALLVPRGRAQTVARALTTLGPDDRVRILVNGPWPPYSFVGQDQREE